MNSDRAGFLAKRAEKTQIKMIRRSKVFKDRIKGILSSIEETSKEGKNKITITYMENCKTDIEIRRFLRERKFDTSPGYDGPNSMRIEWYGRN